ncbi:MAG: hypothetical protein KDK55_05050 [Chlamydiia bacterium]|nr:hypothetical protein [Chlamydiia bacterium]
MKKLFVTVLTVLTCGAVYALPVGNPSEASLLCDGLFWEGSCCMDPCDPCASWCDAVSFRLGFYGDYVFNRHLELDNGSHKDIENTEIFTNAGYFALNMLDRLDIFALLGTTNVFIDTNAIAFTNNNALRDRRIEIETSTDFSWSVGLRASIWECGCTTLGGEFQYFRACPGITRVTVGGDSSVYPNGPDLSWNEWQIGLGISHRVNMLVPYIAVKWSSVKVGASDAMFTFGEDVVSLLDLNDKKGWGYAAGVTLVDCEKAAVTAEGRWADEKAFYVNGQIRF